MLKPNGTEQTRAVAERIRDVADEFRRFGVPVYLIYYGFADEDHTTANGGLYLVEYKPERGDVLVRKEEMSPFRHSDIGGDDLHNVLKARQIDTPWVAGFQASLCITELGLDALDKGYKVHLLEDCIGENDPIPELAVSRALGELEKHGAIRCNSLEALSYLQGLRHYERTAEHVLEY